MKYTDLSARKAIYLGHYTSLDSTIKAEAEKLSTLEIDRALRKWDRTGWSPDTTPPDVESIALKLASAFYIRIDVSRNNPMADPDNVRSWLKEARAELRELASAEMLIGHDGEPQYADRAGDFGDDRVIDIYA